MIDVFGGSIPFRSVIDVIKNVGDYMGTAVHQHVYTARILKHKKDSLYIKGEFAPNLRKLTRNNIEQDEEVQCFINLNTSDSEESFDDKQHSQQKLKNKNIRRSDDKSIDMVHRKKFLVIKDSSARLKLLKKSSDSLKVEERNSDEKINNEFSQKRPDPSIYPPKTYLGRRKNRRKLIREQENADSIFEKFLNDFGEVDKKQL